MPVILRPCDYDRWPDREETEQLPLNLLRSYDAEEMEMHEADPKVGNDPVPRHGSAGGLKQTSRWGSWNAPPRLFKKMPADEQRLCRSEMQAGLMNRS